MSASTVAKRHDEPLILVLSAFTVCRFICFDAARFVCLCQLSSVLSLSPLCELPNSCTSVPFG